MSKLILKTGVQLAGLQLPMRKVLKTAAELWAEHGQTIVVTSGLEGTHSPGSLHYYGYALDFRSRYFSPETVAKLCDQLRSALGTDYLVLDEKTHIHVQCQLALTEIYPRA